MVTLVIRGAHKMPRFMTRTSLPMPSLTNESNVELSATFDAMKSWLQDPANRAQLNLTQISPGKIRQITVVRDPTTGVPQLSVPNAGLGHLAPLNTIAAAYAASQPQIASMLGFKPIPPPPMPPVPNTAPVPAPAPALPPPPAPGTPGALIAQQGVTNRLISSLPPNLLGAVLPLLQQSPETLQGLADRLQQENPDRVIRTISRRRPRAPLVKT